MREEIRKVSTAALGSIMREEWRQQVLERHPDEADIDWREEMRSTALAAAAAAGGHVLDGAPVPGMATVHLGEEFFYIDYRTAPKSVGIEYPDPEE